MATFLERLGFEVTAEGRLPATAARALYGLDAEAAEVELRMPGAARGWIRVVATPHPAAEHQVFARGPHAIDLYTTDMKRSLELAAAAGARCRPAATYKVGPLELTEAKTIGPDGFAVVFIQVARRRPSLLDREPDRLHSEVHSLVFTVDSVTEALPFWKERAGLSAFLDATIVEPAVCSFMGLPRNDVPLRLAMLADGESRPARLELLEFPQDAGPSLPTWPLRAGLHAAGFGVTSIEEARRALPGASFGEVAEVDTPVHSRTRAVAAVAPGGVRFELWEAHPRT
jgi:hypothetical protein